MTSLLRADTADALLRDVAVVQARHRQPSVVAGVVRDGALAWSGSRGDVEGDASDMQYRIGSLTKMMTAVLVLQCRDEGLLDLDEPIVAYMRQSPWPDTPLRRLLAHAAGLPAEPEGPWWERHDDAELGDLLTRIDQQPLATAQGSQFHYSNVGYALLGAVVEQVRGGSWSDVLRERGARSARPAAHHVRARPRRTHRAGRCTRGLGGSRRSRTPTPGRWHPPDSCGARSATWPAGQRSGSTRTRRCSTPARPRRCGGPLPRRPATRAAARTGWG